MLEMQKDQCEWRVVENLALVKRIACPLISPFPSSVQLDDLIRAGMIGLLEASRNYDPAQGAKGREGCNKLKSRGATICAQDEQTSTIYGMPAAVAPIAELILPLKENGKKIALNS